jgi:hypothetical protein
MNTPPEKVYKSFQEFWPFYLSEHANKKNRRLHFMGTMIVFIILISAIATAYWTLLWIIPFAGYGFAWVGHFIVEKNRPATFKHPLWSLIGDFKMFFMTLAGRLPRELEKYAIQDHANIK